MDDSKIFEAEQAYQEAMQALRKGLRDLARELAMRSAQLNPQNEQPWLLLAALSNPYESLGYLQTALRINPTSVRARQGLQWAQGRIQKEELQNQFMGIIKNIRRIPAKPEQEQSSPTPATIVHDRLPTWPVIPLQVQSRPVSEAELWEIDIEKIITPGKFVFDFVLNGFFTAYHQISITGTGMGEMHSHTYRMQIMAAAELVTRNNQILVSYESIHSVVDRICKAYEGKTLNDLPPFKKLQPSTENLVGVIAQQLEKLSSGKQYKIYEVTLMESPTVGVVYKNMDIIRTFQ